MSPQPTLPLSFAESLIKVRNFLLQSPPQSPSQLLINHPHILRNIHINTANDILLYLIRLPQQKINILIVIDPDNVRHRVFPLVLVL